MAIVGARGRSVLVHAVDFCRLAIVLIVLLTMSGAGSAPEHGGHDIDQLVVAAEQQPIGTCHQASHQCSVAVELAALWPDPITVVQRSQLRPSGDLPYYEVFQSFDTPPPRA